MIKTEIVLAYWPATNEYEFVCEGEDYRFKFPAAIITMHDDLYWSKVIAGYLAHALQHLSTYHGRVDYEAKDSAYSGLRSRDSGEDVRDESDGTVPCGPVSSENQSST